MFTASEDRERYPISLGRECAFSLTHHPERKSRDPVEVTLKVSARDPSTPLGMTGEEFALRANMDSARRANAAGWSGSFGMRAGLIVFVSVILVQLVLAV